MVGGPDEFSRQSAYESRAAKIITQGSLDLESHPPRLMHANWELDGSKFEMFNNVSENRGSTPQIGTGNGRFDKDLLPYQRIDLNYGC